MADLPGGGRGYEGDIAADLRQGKTLNGKDYKVHLDGYNQLDLLTKGSGKSKRRRDLLLRRGGSRRGADR